MPEKPANTLGAQLRRRHPDRIPVVVDVRRVLGDDARPLKLLVQSDMTAGSLVYAVRLKIKQLRRDAVADHSALFVLVGTYLPPSSHRVSALPRDAKEDVVHATCVLESTFG